MNLYELKRFAEEYHKIHGMRKGQAFMNALPMAMYREVLNNEYDCYFRDNKLEDCFNYLMKYHNTKIDTLFVDTYEEKIYEDDHVIVENKSGVIIYDYDILSNVIEFKIEFDDDTKMSLKDAITKSLRIEVVINSFDADYLFLSNFYDSKVTVFGHTFRNAESAFQAMKDPSRVEEFVNITPHVAKKLGREVELRKDWEDVKYDIMKQIIYGKFQQNEVLKKKLKETGTKAIVEGNYWHDNIWGECSCKKCEGKIKTNLLGKILMEVRDNI